MMHSLYQYIKSYSFQLTITIIHKTVIIVCWNTGKSSYQTLLISNLEFGMIRIDISDIYSSKYSEEFASDISVWIMILELCPQ